MNHVRAWIRQWLERPKVRPWALLGPLVVVFFALPLLRPVRHPTQMDADEAARLATVRALVETRTLAISDAREIPAAREFVFNNRIYSDQAPMMSLLLAAAYWVLLRAGYSLANSPVL